MAVLEKPIEQGMIAEVSGKLDAIESVDVQKRLFSILDKGQPNLIIDLQKVDYISSAGMRTLLLVTKKAKDLPTNLCIINVSPQNKEVLEMAGFLTILNVYNDLDAALSQLKLKKSK